MTLCPVCSQPMFARFVDVTTFGEDAPQWVEAKTYCPNCLEQDLTAEVKAWRSIADDLYRELRQHEEPVPQSVINALVRYDRQTQGRH